MAFKFVAVLCLISMAAAGDLNHLANHQTQIHHDDGHGHGGQSYSSVSLGHGGQQLSGHGLGHSLSGGHGLVVNRDYSSHGLNHNLGHVATVGHVATLGHSNLGHVATLGHSNLGHVSTIGHSNLGHVATLGHSTHHGLNHGSIVSSHGLRSGHNDGHYNHHEEHHAPAHYAFEYSVHDDHTGDIKEQKEQRDGDVVQGHYSLVDADGHKRIVHYSADKHSGFNAHVERQGLSHGLVAPAVAHHAVAPVKILSGPAILSSHGAVASHHGGLSHGNAYNTHVVSHHGNQGISHGVYHH